MAGKTYAILGGGGSFGIHAALYLLDANVLSAVKGMRPVSEIATLRRHNAARVHFPT